jgi:hypothetical protein
MSKELIIETLIDKMFEFAGHPIRYNDIKDSKDEWYTRWTMTEEQNKKWREWAINYLKKNGFLNPKREIDFFDLNYGLKILN